MTHKSSIRTRLFLSILLCFLPIHGLLIYIFISRYNDVLNGRISHNLAQSLIVVRNQFFEPMDHMKTVLQFPANAPHLKRLIHTRDRTGLISELSNWAVMMPAMEIMAVSDRNGVILAARNFSKSASLAPFSAMVREAQRKREPVTAIQ